MYQCDGLWNCHAYRHTVQAERQAAAGVLGFVVGNGGVAKTHCPARTGNATAEMCRSISCDCAADDVQISARTDG